VKVVTVIGARPQFIKAAPVSRAFRSAEARKSIEEVIVHTGQHYDASMSQVFFDQLGLPKPKYNLGVGSGSHGEQTGQMLAGLEKIMLEEQPHHVLIYGDTNSTLAGALAASKLHIPLAHVEAGLRSFNRRMPEEINRIIADHTSDLLFAPTETAVENLRREGIVRGVHLVGDVMQDAIADSVEVAKEKSVILEKLKVKAGNYLLVTVHRAENTDDPCRLSGILKAIRALSAESDTIWPLHPRLRKHLAYAEAFSQHLRLIEPVAYLDMLELQRNAKVVLTDSGGIQKEAQWLEVPCVTLRDETEWVETVECGWNRLAGADPDRITSAVLSACQERPSQRYPILSSGAARRITAALAN